MMPPSFHSIFPPLASLRRMHGEWPAWFAICASLPIATIWLFDHVGTRFPELAPTLQLDFIIVLCVTVILALAGIIATLSRGTIGSGTIFALGCLYGAGVFVRVLGTALLDPSNADWLLRNDLAQHYGGWAMFRSSPWSWPPGAIGTMSYPVGTSIVYTDSLPLFAFLFKPFSALLPPTFQYIGLWMLLSFTFQGGFAALLMRRFSSSPAVCVAAAALFVSAPILIDRYGHDTLTAQWLVLASFWLYLRETPAPRAPPTAFWPWLLVSAIAALVHPYLATMVLAIMSASLIHTNLVENRASMYTIVRVAMLTGSLVLVLWWTSGAFIIPKSSASGGVAYGHYSFNVLGFFNAGGHSRFVPPIPVGPGQHEGFAWPGLGMWLLFVIVMLQALWHRGSWLVAGKRHWPIALCVLALAAFATSSVVMFGPWVLYERPLQNPLVAMFRSSGRFIWPLYYLLMLVAIGNLVRRLPHAAASGLLLMALAIQLADGRNIAVHYASRRIDAQGAPDGTLLFDPRWKTLATGRRHLTLLPPKGCGPSDIYLPFLLFAAENTMTINSAYLARTSAKRVARYCGELRTRLDHGITAADELYVMVDETWMEQFPSMLDGLECITLDGYSVCIKAASLQDPQL